MSAATRPACLPSEKCLELTRWSPIQRLFRHRAVNWLLMTVALVGFLIAIAAGILGTAAGSANFAIVYVWIVWWGLLMGVLLPLGGRLWCLICPLPAPGEWLQRGSLVASPANGCPVRPGVSRSRRWPKALQSIWLQNASFLAMALLSAVILTRPSVTGWILLGLLALCVVLALLFERRAFCRYVCPVGGFIGLYSMLSPLELRVRDPLVCQEHRSKDCYLGNAAGYGCPWLEQPWRMERNAYCGLCGECIRACTKDNITLNLRLPGHDLLAVQGWRLDEAYKAFIMLTSAVIYPVVFLGPWGRLKAWANLEEFVGFGIYALAFLGLSLVVVPTLQFGVAALTRWAAGFDEVPLRRLFVPLAYPLVPLGLAAWVAFTLSFVFANVSYAFPVLSDPFGWGWNLLGTRDVAWRPWLMEWVPTVQAALLIVGLVASIWTADAVLRRLAEGRQRIGGLTVQAAALTALTVVFLWLYLGAFA